MSTTVLSLASLNACPDPLLRGLPIRFTARFVPLGRVIRVESNSSAVIDAALESFGAYGEPPPSVLPDITLRICADPTFHDAEPWPVPLYRALEHLFHISCGSANFAVADLRTGTAIGFVSLEMVQDRSFFRNVFLECLFYVFAVHQSHTPVHCSCVSLNGHGILICGASGAGKTTLAYACAKTGMEVVSDDVIHLEWDRQTEQLKLWGNPWRMRLAPESGGLFPELSGRSPTLRNDHEWYLDLSISEEFGGQARSKCEPNVLVFLERSSSSAGLECTRLEPACVLDRLKRDIVLDEASVVERHYAVLNRLARVRAFAFRYSGHPSAAVSALRNLLDVSS
ncbi:MAG: hypothetical protein L0387_37760 [Acidobacteria bacterium]|nr:hypothetical protein [Acidobacteriota bacterium]MCI0627331.1 hypothetical protein [Acidobacteriota bacterium]MCI0723572.1 hypothetical protein [Acidobacteriota bacterium]